MEAWSAANDVSLSSAIMNGVSDVDVLSARLAVSPDEKSVLTHNLVEGFDRYRIDHLVHAKTYSISSEEGVMLPVCIMRDGETMLLGSTLGTAHVVDIDDGRVLQTLKHPGKVYTI